MVEGYISYKCITFYSRYFNVVKDVLNWPWKNDENNPNEDVYLFATMDQLKGMVQMVEIPELNLVQAQRYVLLYFDALITIMG